MKLLEIVNNGYQRALASIVYKFFDKKRIGITVNEELAEKFHKQELCNSKKENSI